MRRTDRAFTLIELLICVSIMLIISLAAARFYILPMRQQREIEARADIREAARTVHRTLVADLVGASSVQVDASTGRTTVNLPDDSCVVYTFANEVLTREQDGGSTLLSAGLKEIAWTVGPGAPVEVSIVYVYNDGQKRIEIPDTVVVTPRVGMEGGRP